MLLDSDDIFDTRGFLGSLITNPSFKIRNSKWRIQYSGRKGKYLLDCDDIWYSIIFGLAEDESKLKIQKFKVADPIWRTIIQKFT